MIHHECACIFPLPYYHALSGGEKNINKVPCGESWNSSIKRSGKTNTELFSSLHQLFDVLSHRTWGRTSHILAQDRETNEDEWDFLCSSVTRVKGHQRIRLIKSLKYKSAVPSWSSWRVPHPWGSPCRACSSGRQAAVPSASWKGRLCPPLGPCSGRCYRWERSRRQQRTVWRLKQCLCVIMCVFASKDIVPAKPDTGHGSTWTPSRSTGSHPAAFLKHKKKYIIGHF